MRFALLLAAVLLPFSAFAEKYGSETTVTLAGTYYVPGTLVTQTLNNGDTRDTATPVITQINNRTILQAMVTRSLIPSLNGYQLVMVAHGHMADGVSWFATKATGTPVAVPSDLLTLSVNDGPAKGVMVIDSNSNLKSLNQQTYNLSSLTQGNFTGSGLLTQNWSAKAVKNGAVTEVVELVASTANFTGTVTASPNAGVGTLDFKLSGAKTVDLTRYGMASSSSSSSSGSASNTYTGGTSLSGGSVSLTGTFGGGNLHIGYGSLTITGMTLDLSGATFLGTGTLTINTTTGGSATGLVVDADGNVTQFPTFGTSLPGTLIIITSSGTHTYTHDADGVWTLVTP